MLRARYVFGDDNRISRKLMPGFAIVNLSKLNLTSAIVLFHLMPTSVLLA